VPQLVAVMEVMQILHVSQELAEELLAAHDGVISDTIAAALDGHHG
jgi:hypothetical protein